jgi:hypothetical protein
VNRVAKIESDGTVISFQNDNKGMTDDNGVQYPRNIWQVWSDDELNAIGYARFEEQRIPDDKRSTGSTDTFADGRVTRTHTTKDYVPPPPPPDKTPTIEDPDDESKTIPNPEYDHGYERQKLYPSTDDLIVALWEKVVEERPEAAAALEESRQAIKTRFPKGE